MSAEGIGLALSITTAVIGAIVKFALMTEEHKQMRKDLGYLTKELSLMKQTLPELKQLEEKLDRLERQNDQQLSMLQQQREWMIGAGLRPEWDIERTPPHGIKRPPGGNR